MTKEKKFFVLWVGVHKATFSKASRENIDMAEVKKMLSKEDYQKVSGKQDCINMIFYIEMNIVLKNHLLFHIGV